MSNPTSNQVLHPENPSMGKETSNPKENGQTRVLHDGSLLYYEPLTKTEGGRSNHHRLSKEYIVDNLTVPAVRLNDIRPRLVQEASSKLSYRFPKKRGFEDTNVTAFVKKDYNFGPNRENRPDRLFQIESDGAKGEKPNGYVMYEGQVVLDAFDHGLRNFGTQLPMYVSSELEGHDIEDYLRRNWEITLYDLIARAPNGYWTGDPEAENQRGEKVKTNKWHNGPPRMGTFSMRATRFRTEAGCLSWSKKEGTAPKNKRILDLIPTQYKDPAINSTKGWRDLNPAELKTIKDGAMKTPQKARKKNRAAKAEKDRQDKESTMEGSVEGEPYLKDGESISYGEEDAWVGALYEQDDDGLPGYGSGDLDGPMPGPQVHRMNPQAIKHWQAPSAVGEIPEDDFENEPSLLNSTQPRKRSRNALIAASEEGSNVLAHSPVNFATNAQSLGNDEAISNIPKSRVARKQLDHNGQRGIHDSGPHVHFAQYDNIDSMNQRYHIPPFRVQRKKPTSSKTVEKRKRTSSNTTEHFKGQPPKKRTDERATKQTLAPSFQTTTESVPGVEDSGFGFSAQMDEQDTAFSQTATYASNAFFQDLNRYADEEDCKEEDNAIEQPEQFPPFNKEHEDSERATPPIYWP